MSEQFQPGDMIEYVDASPCFSTGESTLTLHAIYCVTDFYPAGAVDPLDDLMWKFSAVELREHPTTDRTGWLARRFRKIYRPDPKLIERLTAEPILPDAPVKQPGRVEA